MIETEREPRRPHVRSTWTVGLDLGQAQDYTGIVAVEERTPIGWDSYPTEEPTYNVRHIERLALGTPYPKQVEHVAKLLNTPQLVTAQLVVDHTGVGRAVVDLLRAANLPKGLTAVSIHGGDQVTHDGDVYRVSKRDLVAAVAVLLATGRLKISAGLPDAAILQAELLGFRVRIDSVTAHDSYAAWREGAHDDLVLALALAVWHAREVGQDLQVLVL